jgi:hypothetical protein
MHNASTSVMDRPFRLWHSWPALELCSKSIKRCRQHVRPCLLDASDSPAAAASGGRAPLEIQFSRERRRHEFFALSRVKGKLPPSSNRVESAILLPSHARLGKEEESWSTRRWLATKANSIRAPRHRATMWRPHTFTRENASGPVASLNA